jgi:autotransporter-associated beta strand protein
MRDSTRRLRRRRQQQQQQKTNSVDSDFKVGQRQTGRSPALRCAAWAAVLPLGAAALVAHADTKYWDNDGTPPVNGGSGVWDQLTARWSSDPLGTSYDVWNNGNNPSDDAVFGGSGGVVQFGSPISAASLTFNSDYILVNTNSTSLNPLTLNNASIIDTGSNRVELFAPITGSTGWVKNGTGLLIFHGNNSNNNTGPVIVNAGTMALGNTQFANIPDSSPVTVAAGATLDFGTLNHSAYNDSMGTISGAGNITLGTISGLGINTGSQIVFGGTGDATWAGQISGVGGRLVKGGSGAWILGGTNTFGGLFTVQLGTIRLASTTALMGGSNTLFVNGSNTLFDMNGMSPTIGSLNGGGTGTTVALGNGNLTLGTDNLASTYNGIVSGSGGIIKVGTGVQVLANVASTYTGGVTVRAGILVASADSRLGAVPGAPTPGYISLDGGTLANFTGAPYTINANRGIDITASGGGLMAVANMTYNGVITGTGLLTKSGTGTLTLGSSNPYLGDTFIADGSITSTLSSLSLTTGTPLGLGLIAMRTSTLNLQPTNVAGAVVYSLAGGPGSRFVYGPGSTLGLSGGGNISLTATIGNLAALPNTSVVRAPGGSLLIQPTDGLSQLGAGTVKLLVNGGIPVTNGIVSPSIMAQNGAGLTTAEFLNYDAVNGFRQAAYSPLTDINLADSTTVFEATSAQTLTNDAAVYSIVSRGQAIGGAFGLKVGSGSGEAGVILNSGASINTSALNFGGADGVIYVGGGSGATINAPITGAGALTKVGPDTLTLGGNSTYSGVTTIGQGAVTLAVSNALPTNTTLAMGAGSTFALNGNTQTIGSLTSESITSRIDLGSNGVLTVSGSNSTRFLGSIVGTGGSSTLVQDGPGTLTLGQPLAIGAIPSAVNSFDKLVVRNGGVVSIGTANSTPATPLTNTPDVYTLDGGTLRITSLAVASLSGGGASTFSFGTGRGIVLTGAGGTFDVTQSREIVIANAAGNIFSGTGSLTKTGPGFFRMLAGNTYTGKTIIREGNIQLNGDTGFGTAPSDFVPDQLTFDGGMFQPNAGFNIVANRGVYVTTNGGTLNLGASLGINSVISGPGALTVVAQNILTLYPGNGTAVNTFNGLILTNGRTDFYVSGAAGTGAITVDPKFPVTLQKTSQISDTVLNNPVTLGPGGPIYFAASSGAVGALVFNGKITGPNNIYRSSGTIVNQAPPLGQGTVVLGNSLNDFTGQVIITTGTLAAAADHALGSTNAGTVVFPLGSLGFEGNINYTSLEPVTLAGGDISNVSGSNSFSGPIFMTNDSTITVKPGGSLTLNGNITGSGGKLSAIGDNVTLNGINTFTGPLNVGSSDTGQAGTVTVTSDSNLGAATSSVVLNAGSLIAAASFASNRPFMFTAVNPVSIDALTGTALAITGQVTTTGDISKGSNGGTVLIASGGTVSLGSANLTVNGGTLAFSGSTTLSTTGVITVNDAANLRFVAGGPNTSTRLTHQANDLVINGTGNVDLENHELLLNNTNPNTIKGYLAQAYDPNGNADWGQRGLTSSFAKTNPVTYSVGYAYGGDQSAQDAAVATHNGTVLGPNQTVVRAVLTGDANMDGRVDFFDITQLLGYKYNTGQAASYTDGDLDYNGHVDFFDIVLLLSANYNTGQTFGPAAARAVPALTHGASPTGVVASATTIGVPGDGKPDFEYNPLTGDLKFRTDGGTFTTTGGSASFVSSLTISSASGILLGGGASAAFAGGTGATLTSTLLSSALTNSPGFSDGFDIGLVLAPGMSAATLTADLTVKYQSLNGGSLKTADITVPEPAGLALLGLGASGLLARRRKAGKLRRL